MIPVPTLNLERNVFCPNREETEDDPSQGYSQDEDETDESASGEEEEPFGFSSVFGVGINDAALNTVEERDVARSEESTQPPAHLSSSDGLMSRPVPEVDSGTRSQDLGDIGVNGEQVVDKDLYVPTKSTPTWSPSIGVINWANNHFDEEWDLETVKNYEGRFVAPQWCKHLFTPVPLTKAMDQALSSQYTKDTDKFFNRRETERVLFRAAKDICVAYGPIFQGLGMLAERGDCGAERRLLSEGILGIASAMHKITRARRELLRRYFDLGVARELYSFAPTHTQFFGGSSLDDRVEEAKALSEARNNLFFRPKPKTYKSKTSQFYSKTGFQDQNQQKSQTNRRRGRGRGRGRRSKINKGQTAAKTSESK